MHIVDMIYFDLVKIFLGFLIINAAALVATDQDVNHDLKRMQPPSEKSDKWVPQPTEKRSDQYTDVYETTEERIELDHGHVDPQRHQPHLQDEYHEEKTVEYLEDTKAPQAYKFGFEIKDAHEGHQYRHEQKDSKGTIQGRFGYRDAKGQYRQVEYVADNHGFRANVKTNEAGITDQNPANVQIQKDGNEVLQDYPQHADASHSADRDSAYSHKKSAISEQYYRQPVKEDQPPGDVPEYGGHIKKPGHYEADSQHLYAHGEPKKYHGSENEHSATYEGGPTSAVHRYYVREHEPHHDIREHEPFHNIREHEPHYDVAEHEPHHEHSSSSPSQEHYRNVPDTDHKKRHEESPKAKSYVRKPSTYQYELNSEGYSYRYPKRPYSNDYEAPQAVHTHQEHDKEYHHHKQEKPVRVLHEVPLKEDRHVVSDHENYRNSYTDKEVEHQPQRVILPQTAKSESHIYHPEHFQHHDHSSRDHEYPQTERYALKYEHSEDALGEKKLGHSKIPDDFSKNAPVQYIQVIEDHQQPSADTYGKEKASYGHRQIPYMKTEPGPQSVVVIHPKENILHSQKETAFGERSYEHPHPSYQTIRQNNPIQYEEFTQGNQGHPTKYNLQNSEQGALKEAVLELNAEVYKELVEKQSPGRRIVAIPINHVNNGHSNYANSGKSSSHPKADKPHGILHIPLDGKSRSTIDLKSLPLVLEIPHGKNANHQKPEGTYQEHTSHSKSPVVYSQSSQAHTVPVSKASGRYHRNKEYAKSKWIPMTPTWKQIRRKSPYEDGSPTLRSYESRIPRVALKISNGEMLHFTQGESSERVTDFRRKLSPIAKDSNYKLGQRLLTALQS